MPPRLPRPRLPVLVVAVSLAALIIPLDAARPLADRVTIRRDIYGIPHILGETEAAVGLGFGYAQAEDHAEEMARRFLAARGEAARYFGPSALDGDLAAKRLDTPGEARRALSTLNRTFREVLEGFAEGYNLYVSQHRTALPDWVTPITAADALAETRASAANEAASPALVRSLERKYPSGTSRTTSAEVADAADELGDRDGSNALALSGSRTTSGAPMLLGNPHLRWQQLYWEAHVTVRGRLDFYGSTLVGLPWLRAGFNDRIAYVQTNNSPDNDDVFALPLDPGKPDHYRFGGKSMPLTPVIVSADVRQEDGSLKTERRTYWKSHVGPIVYRTNTTAFAFRSTALDAWRFFESFWRLSHARSLGDYRRVLGMRLSPTSNYTFADADGNVFYYWNARMPKRRDDGTSYDLDVPGEKKYVWRKLHPAKDLPQLLNPPGGSIQNANNPPAFVSLQTMLDPARYPSYFEHGELALRPQLALQMLGERAKFSVDDVKRLKFDTRLLLADRVKPALLEAVRGLAAPASELKEAAALLQAWDNRASATSRGAVLFQRFWDTYRAEVRQPFAEPWDAGRPATTPGGIANVDAALRHLAEAVKWTKATYGSADVAWGDAYRYRFGDIDLPGEGATGSLGAYRVQTYDVVPGNGPVRIAGWGTGERQLAGFGDGWILLVHFTRPVQAFSLLAYGQTTDRTSPHSRDQIALLANHELRPVFYTDADIRAHLEREYRPR